MNRSLVLPLVLLLSVFVMSCTEAITTAPIEDSAAARSGDVAALTQDQYPRLLLGGTARCEAEGLAVDCAAKAAPAANGFASPLFGLATAPNGDILVADAGAGVAVFDGTDAYTEIAMPGVSDMAPIGRGSMWLLVGLNGAPGSDTGQGLYRASKGKARPLVDLYDFEAANNPDGQSVDSNPFDVASLGGRAALVADAGANALLQVDNQGNTEVLAVFPNELVSTDNIKALAGCPDSGAPFCFLPPMMPAQPVPTSVAVGPDGYYYVGELKGFPAPTDASNIWRVSPDASWAQCGSSPDCVKVFDGGFTSVIDLAFDAEGTLYVTEFDELSWFAVEVLGVIGGGTINACDVGAGTCSEVASGIPILTAITFGKDGALWATQNALIPGAAGVVSVP